MYISQIINMYLIGTAIGSLYSKSIAVMDRILSNREIKHRKWRSAFKWLIVAGAVILLWYFVIQKWNQGVPYSRLNIAIAERGAVDQRLVAQGILIPAFEIEVNAMVSSEITSVFHTVGATISPGDILLQLDREILESAFEQQSDALALRTLDIQKSKLNFAKDLDYKAAMKALALQELEAQVTAQKHLFTIGGATGEEVEKAEIALKIARLEKSILDNELEFHQQLNQKEIESLQLSYNIDRKKLQEESHKLKATQIVSRHHGVITYINEDIGKLIQPGDLLVRIANLDRFKVEATIAERHGDRLIPGQSVRVQVGTTELEAFVSKIAPVVENNLIKFEATFAIRDDMPDMRSNMRVEVRILTEEVEDAIRIKQGPAFTGAIHQKAFVVKDGVARKKVIQKGLSNTRYLQVTEGLWPGDSVIISDINAYIHMDQFKLKK